MEPSPAPAASRHGTVRLHGVLRCADAEEARTVTRHLPQHLTLTRAEPGCLSFRVEPSAEPLVWEVAEEFADAGAFRAHQQRVAASAWGRATADIAREYPVEGLPEEGEEG